MDTRHPVDLNLHIDELVLHGFEHLDRAELGVAVRQSLIQLFHESGPPSSIQRSGEVGRLEGSGIDLPANASASEIGARIARSIHGSFPS